jgi:NAD(P)-dependent dehydrogenase (short-subunit alcohol dehydrogenase family)
MNTTGLNGKVALVTGAGKDRGIGRAIAARLARDGADVVVADLCKKPGDEKDEIWSGLQRRAGEIEALGRRALAVHADITDEKSVDGMIAAIKEKFGRLDIVCNNAGAAFAMNLSYMLSPADWRKMIDINLTGTFIVSRAAAQWMTRMKNGGCIINTSSWRGFAPPAFMAAYCAAKAGVISLTEVMALELAPFNIRVNAICPGKVETDMERWGWELKAGAAGKTVEQIMEDEKKKIPLGRFASPDDVAGLVAFLASDEGSYITGEAIPYTGGMTLVRV